MNNNMMKLRYNKQKKWLVLGSILLGIMLTTFIIYRLDTRAREQLLATQESLAEEVLRFHVLANSDSQEDQDLKMEVKDAVITYMEAYLVGEDSVLMTKVWVENHLDEIQEICEAIIRESGYMYPVMVGLNESYFPVKSYGDVTFPAGVYEALQINIGDANGQNWWCCLYPNLCFIDATVAVVSEEGKECLQEVLTIEEYEMITTTTEFKVDWFFFSW